MLSEKRWEATLSVHHLRSRDWRPDELQLLRDVAARLWPAAKRAWAMESLRESETRARRTLAEQMVAGVAECDAAGKFTLGNQRHCGIVRYIKARLLGFRIGEVTHPGDWPHNAELTAVSLKTARVSSSRSVIVARTVRMSGSTATSRPSVTRRAKSKNQWPS